jgi:metal-dependent amidase/aminoacylase/carboxypeptidase family protein
LGHSQEEVNTKNIICDFLRDFKFDIPPNIQMHNILSNTVLDKDDEDLKSSFMWEIGVWDSHEPDPVMFNAEYDGLKFGDTVYQACGHNLIAMASISATIFAASHMLKISDTVKEWRIKLVGTPAEESAGAKVRLAEDDKIYDNAKGCLMVHPISCPSGVDVEGVAWTTSLANQVVKTTFKGLPAHASLSPWLGKNALDAAVCAYNSISMLRQQTYPGNRICAIIKCDNATNIIPEYAELSVCVRAETKKDLLDLKKNVENCMNGAATATNCETRPCALGEVTSGMKEGIME